MKLTTLKDAKIRRILFWTAVAHIKIFIKERIKNKHIHFTHNDEPYTHLELARDNFVHFSEKQKWTKMRN